MKTLHRLAWLLFFLTACSPEWHLKKAVSKGASVKADTVWSEVITEKTVTDTVIRFQSVNKILAGDTVTIETVRWRSKTVIDTLTKTVYQQVECRPDTIRIATAVNTEISAGYSKWELIGSTLGGILFCALMAFFAYKFAGLVQRRG